MVTKEFILIDIRRLANERNGRIGLKVFLSATGIPEKQVLGRSSVFWKGSFLHAGLITTVFHEIFREFNQRFEQANVTFSSGYVYNIALGYT